ncbi:MAG: hypothetical protein F4X16_05530 [Caldilineaceae bacterium SB0661_bin_34]|nr:hypothetical protein [Caldilineaceae bacterium SB0661_bin_34]
MTTINTALDANVKARELTGTAAVPVAAHPLPAVISSDYYNLTEADGWPVAGLLVLLDRQHTPVRAEVHLYDNTMGRRQDAALQIAYRVLEEQYRAPSEESARLPVRIMRTRQQLDTVGVRLDIGEPIQDARLGVTGIGGWNNARTLLALLLALLLIGGVVGAFSLRQRAPISSAPAGADTAAPAQSDVISDLLPAGAPPAPVNETSMATGTVGASPAPGVAATSQEAAESVPPTAGSAPIAEQPSLEDYVNPYPPQTNDLQPSTVAHPFSLLDRAEVVVGHLAFQTEPNPDTAFSFAWKEAGTQVTIVGGPVWLAGDSETIEWWFVATDDGAEGWMAANGSTQRYLNPVE